MKTPTLLLLSITLIMKTPLITTGQQIDKSTEYKLDNETLHKIEKVVKDSRIPMFQAAYFNGKETQLLEFINESYIAPASKFIAPVSKLEAVFQAASLSKPLFAYIVMKMAGEGLIDLDKPIVDYIGQDRFLSNQIEWAKALTARVILSHKSGLPNWAVSPSSNEWPTSSLVFKFKPDSTFGYSGEGYTLLQKAIEKIKGQSLQQIATKEVFIPLRMNSSSYEWGREDIPSLNYDLIAADGYNSEGQNRGKGRHPRANSAYTLRTTATDYSLFLEALVNGVGLEPQYHKAMFDPVVQAIRYSDRDRICDNSIFWSLGLGIEKNSELGNIFFHWGDNGNFKALFLIVPKQGTHLVYLTNSAHGHSMINIITLLFFKNQLPLALSSWIND